ncbi:Serine/threonine protein kinase [Chondrus crispus]|uniref:Serine/threonine protein kinase n=1 Tax=Chondrus crispus TaxID=2769 RepID=R7Q8D0_CHOCR|nr:Serine/threonine protein kinase [Chondrus crispus]CDF34043.1 Serine/threonine protein kinase [Chondrus crispus]|eukprot:XP_005713862.1 Serine/threonine protein kinase [Chondrus crispus]
MAPFHQVGKYVIKHKIGEGAFAEVRLATHQETKEEFAVKVFDRDALPKTHFERNIKREIKIMQHLRHPNIVAIHAVLVTEKKLYLVMELVRGVELYDVIVSKRRIDEPTSRRYFQQMVDALVYCHQCGVVHRDLKPENLLVDGNGNIKITDFGMSWMKDSLSPAARAKELLRTQCGTPKYMAPEIIVRPAEGYDGEKLDAWECGMVLYALLAGYLPFSGEDDSSVFRSILNGKLMFPSHFSPGAKDVLTHLLEKDPKKRTSVAEIRTHFWFQVNYQGNLKEKSASAASDKHEKRPREQGGTACVSEVEKERVREQHVAGEREGGSRMVHSPHGDADMVTTEHQKGDEMEGIVYDSSPQSDVSTPQPQQTLIHPINSSAAQQEHRVDGAVLSEEAADINKQQKKSSPQSPRSPGPASHKKSADPHNLGILDNGQGPSPETAHASTPRGNGKEKPKSPKAMKVVDTELPDPATPSRKHKPRWESPKNQRSKVDSEGSKRTPRKAQPLAMRLTSLVKGSNTGGDGADDEEAPLSIRDRLRSPLATVLRSLRSGTAMSADVEAGVPGSKSSWFEVSPSSVAEQARRGNTNLDRPVKPVNDLSSPDQELVQLAGGNFVPTELPPSSSTFKKVTRVFQRKA